ncbi:MAG: hypothetical protein KF729_26095 [Sandaracinaceae bacterium]|nr:hypothetical protein [Sandaracinaceae bacterium]
MRIEIITPCEEPWESMEPRDGGRYCGRCEKVVLDLSVLSRAQAEAKLRALRAAGAKDACVQLAVDRFGDAVFSRPPPRRAPHWAAGLVLVSALSAGCRGEDAPSEPALGALVPDPGAPMRPAEIAVASVPAPTSRAVPASELVSAPAEATAAQRALTAAKHAPPPPPPSYTPTPTIHHMRGGLSLNWP